MSEFVFCTVQYASGSQPTGFQFSTELTGTIPPGGPGCLGIKSATGNEAIKVTLWFNFQPLTPLIQQVVGNRIVITAYAVYRAEYSN